MNKEYIVAQFLQQFDSISTEQVSELSIRLNVQEFKKKTVIQEENKVPENCFYVLQGLVRQYHMIEGVEKTTEFYTESNASISSECYSKKMPADASLICLEDSLLLVGEEENDIKLVQDYPVLQSVMMKIMEDEWYKTQTQLSQYKLLSPEERYLLFLEERVDLKNRVSNAQIASYLGITPESLSRIRKRLLRTS